MTDEEWIQAIQGVGRLLCRLANDDDDYSLRILRHDLAEVAEDEDYTTAVIGTAIMDGWSDEESKEIEVE